MILLRKLKKSDEELKMIKNAISTFKKALQDHQQQWAKDNQQKLAKSKALAQMLGMIGENGLPEINSEPLQRWERRLHLLSHRIKNAKAKAAKNAKPAAREKASPRAAPWRLNLTRFNYSCSTLQADPASITPVQEMILARFLLLKYHLPNRSRPSTPPGKINRPRALPNLKASESSTGLSTPCLSVFSSAVIFKVEK